MVKENRPPQGRSAWLENLLGFLLSFQRFTWEIAGVLFMVIASITLLGLIGLASGAWLTPWAGWLRRWFGIGSVLISVAFGVSGLWILYQRKDDVSASSWGRVVALELTAFASLALISIFKGYSLERAEAGLDGGLVGWGIAEFLRITLSTVLPASAAIVVRNLSLLLIFIIGGIYGLGQIWRIKIWLQRVFEDESYLPPKFQESDSAVSISQGKISKGKDAELKTAGDKKHNHIPPEHRKRFKLGSEEKTTIKPPPRDSRLPPLDILQSEKNVRPNERHINQTAGLIEKTLAEFGIPAKVVGFKTGPTVTQFAVEPGYNQKTGVEGDEGRQKVRVSQISNLQRDLALALSAQRLRIQAPVPGRSFVGIEVPNIRANLVRLRPILETETFYKADSRLALALGRDVSGQTVVADLARMPHLLIAGTTGSGKSICIAAITVCLAMNNSPEDLRIVMIDPKMVELVPFNGLPHLIGKVETDLNRISAVLRWVVSEMERRYKLLEELRARDLESFNRKVRRRKEHENLPRIVVLIDELADLMMSAAEHTEATIVRLAQMARATGIHLVVATQRPSTEVVTGLIKANFPARVSFAVASGIDSRVILDLPGAETLLGRGDMLYLDPELGTPVRSQGVMVTDQEVENVITFWQKEWVEVESDQTPWDVMIAEEEHNLDRDELVEKAIEVIAETGRVSASHLQRSLRIGYPRAARLMDALEDLGIVGPARGGGRERELLIDLDE